VQRSGAFGAAAILLSPSRGSSVERLRPLPRHVGRRGTYNATLKIPNFLQNLLGEAVLGAWREGRRKSRFADFASPDRMSEVGGSHEL